MFCKLFTASQSDSIQEFDLATPKPPWYFCWVTIWWSDILLHYFLIQSKIQGLIKVWQIVHVLKQQAAPHNHTFASVLDCWYDVFIVERCYIRRNWIHGFLLVNNQLTKYYHKSLGDHHNFFWQTWGKPLCSFWSGVVS